MMYLVAFLQSAQDRDGVLHARLLDHDWLETPFERGILFNIFAVLVERGGADGAKLAAGQLRLEQVRSIDGAFRRARADNGVQFVDEQNDLAI